jgi:phosphatidylserine/phosphatidylglycerophosphate/cardiolipin synthase-like enzyme
MKLLTQPGDGVNPLVAAINAAKKSVDIAIFRFDRKEVERAMINAVNRGVEVRALIACTNRGGEKRLRDLEARLLGAGVTVARTADDLVRYHAKYIVVDRQELYLLAFNFTYLDIEQSRSFGIITTNKRAVEEAARLFEADMKRQPYSAQLDWLIVSPSNARHMLAEFIQGAKKELHIYDPCISDPAMIRALEERRKSGVEVKILGRLTRHSAAVEVAKLHDMRLHTRMILRDGKHTFIGSQSLRTVELDRRREVGMIFEDEAVSESLAKTFLSDWKAAEQAKLEKTAATPASKVAKKVAKAVVRDMPSVTPMIETAIQEMGDGSVEMAINAEELEDSVKDAVKHAIKSAIKDAVVMESQAPVEGVKKGID